MKKTIITLILVLIASSTLASDFKVPVYGDKKNELLRSPEKWTLSTLKWVQDEVCAAYVDTYEWAKAQKDNGHTKQAVVKHVLDRAEKRDWAQSDVDNIFKSVDKAYAKYDFSSLLSPEEEDMSELEKCQNQAYEGYRKRKEKKE